MPLTVDRLAFCKYAKTVGAYSFGLYLPLVHLQKRPLKRRVYLYGTVYTLIWWPLFQDYVSMAGQNVKAILSSDFNCTAARDGNSSVTVNNRIRPVSEIAPTGKGKGKVNRAPQQSIGFSSPSSRPWAHRWRTTNVWRVASATPDLWLSSQPPGITAHWMVPNYAAWWQRHTSVSNLPRVALDSGEAGIWTRDLLITSPAPYRYATESHLQILICSLRNNDSVSMP